MKTLSNKLTLLLIAIVVISCTKEDEEKITAPIPVVMQIQKETNGSATSVVTYAYDAEGRLASQISSADSRTYTRDSQGRVIQVSVANSGATRLLVYTYNATGKLEKEERLYGSIVEEKHVYAYFSDRFEDKYYNIDGINTWIYIYYYTSDGKNISKVIRKYGGGSDALFSTIDFSYDNKIGLDLVAPYSNMPKPFYNVNNPVQLIYSDSNGIQLPAVNTSYTYNESGYPLTKTISSDPTITYMY
jgi:YD repeat-containing protein